MRSTNNFLTNTITDNYAHYRQARRGNRHRAGRTGGYRLYRAEGAAMKSDVIIQLHKNFEDYAQEIDGEEFWFARDLQVIVKVSDKVKIACHNAGHSVTDHFPDIRKTIDIGPGAERKYNR